MKMIIGIEWKEQLTNHSKTQTNQEQEKMQRLKLDDEALNNLSNFDCYYAPQLIQTIAFQSEIDIFTRISYQKWFGFEKSFVHSLLFSDHGQDPTAQKSWKYVSGNWAMLLSHVDDSEKVSPVMLFSNFLAFKMNKQSRIVVGLLSIPSSSSTSSSTSISGSLMRGEPWFQDSLSIITEYIYMISNYCNNGYGLVPVAIPLKTLPTIQASSSTSSTVNLADSLEYSKLQSELNEGPVSPIRNAVILSSNLDEKHPKPRIELVDAEPTVRFYSKILSDQDLGNLYASTSSPRWIIMQLEFKNRRQGIFISKDVDEAGIYMSAHVDRLVMIRTDEGEDAGYLRAFEYLPQFSPQRYVADRYIMPNCPVIQIMRDASEIDQKAFELKAADELMLFAEAVRVRKELGLKTMILTGVEFQFDRRKVIVFADMQMKTDFNRLVQIIRAICERALSCYPRVFIQRRMVLELGKEIEKIEASEGKRSFSSFLIPGRSEHTVLDSKNYYKQGAPSFINNENLFVGQNSSKTLFSRYNQGTSRLFSSPSSSSTSASISASTSTPTRARLSGFSQRFREMGINANEPKESDDKDHIFGPDGFSNPQRMS